MKYRKELLSISILIFFMILALGCADTDTDFEYNARQYARKIITENLYSPSTAKFINTELVEIDPYDRYLIRLEFDAQNRFGGTGRYIGYVIVEIYKDEGLMSVHPFAAHVIIEKGKSENYSLSNLKSINSWNKPLEKPIDSNSQESQAIQKEQSDIATESNYDGPLDGDPHEIIVDVPEGSNLNLRSGPSESYDIIGKLPRGTVLMIMDTVKNQSGNVWHEVSVYDTEAQGWVSADYVREVTDSDIIAYDVGWVTIDNLSLRNGPGESFELLEFLAKDTMLLYKYDDEGVKSSDSGDLWLEVETPSGKVGWIKSDYLRRGQ